MWDDAASIYNIGDEPVPEKKVHHFDIASLAQGLDKTASEAAHVNKLQTHVALAEDALQTH